jgi:hypothetical protein
MGVKEDIEAKQNQGTQADTAAANKEKLDAIRKRNADLEKRQAEAKRALKTKKIIYDMYITQLSTGKSKNKTLSKQSLAKINEAAERLNREIADLNKLIAEKPEVVKLPTAAKPQATKPTAGPTGTVLQATQTAKETEAKEKADAAASKKTSSGKGTMPKMPTGDGILTPSDKAIPSSFDPAVARAGEEADRPGSPNIPPKSQRDLESILRQTEFWFDLPDYIFKLDKDLGDLLVKAVNKGYDEKQFLSEAKLTNWWQKNSAPIRTRIIARAKFNELRANGQDVSKTEYAMDTATIKRSVQARARQLGSNLDENAINQIVDRVYEGFLENDTVAIDSFIAPYIGKITSIVGKGTGLQPTGYSGQALQNYQALQAVAKANGLGIKDILPRLSVLPGQNLDDAVLQKLATGELDINRLAQDARMIAAQGSPDYVKNLLQQGYDLEQIYAPYKNVMAQILELNPDEIELNDNTLRSAIGQDREMNVYDFKKALRKDSRWQYTENAREEVSNSVLGVLRDFGFQG